MEFRPHMPVCGKLTKSAANLVVAILLSGCAPNIERELDTDNLETGSIRHLLENTFPRPTQEAFYSASNDQPTPQFIIEWLKDWRDVSIGRSGWELVNDDQAIVVCRKGISEETALENFQAATWIRVLPSEADDTLSFARALPGLRGLCLTQCFFPDTDFETLAQIRNLEWLAIQGGQRSEKGDANHIVSLPNLEVLILQSTEIDDSILSRIKCAGSVRTLSIAGTQVSDKSLAAFIANNQQIQYLDVHSCPQITVLSLPVITTLRKLEFLSIVDSSIVDDDAALAETLKRLRDSLPHCHIQVFD